MLAAAPAEASSAPLPPLLTTADVVRLIGISRVTLWRLEKEQRFLKPIVIGRVKRWQREDVTAFLNAHKAA